MDRIKFLHTDIEVFPLALGAADYGTRYSKEESFAQMDLFVGEGANLIDTAYVYGAWVPGMGNISERVIGQWMKERKNRNRLIISTKGAHPPCEGAYRNRVTPEDIRSDLAGSLEGLGTDHVDLYFLHRDDPQVPVADLLGCLEEQVEKGYIRYYGCSNWRLPRILEAQQVARKEGFKGFVCNQVQFSLAAGCPEGLPDPTWVILDEATYANHLEAEWNIMAYQALAKGHLIKLVRGQEPYADFAPVFGTPATERLAAYLRELEAEGYPADRICLTYLTHQRVPTVPVVSFSKTEQLQAALDHCRTDLPREILDRLEALRAGK